MNLSRKEFFRQGFFSLGETLLEITGIMRQPVSDDKPTEEEPCDQQNQPYCKMFAFPRNERCLARSCGCYSCIESCEMQAITLVPGAGVLIDQDICTGCGNCLYACPVTPKAIGLKPHN